MNTVYHDTPQQPEQRFKVLYVGSESENMEKILSRVDMSVGLSCVHSVSAAMGMARRGVIDCVVIDQCCETNEAALLTAAMAGEENVKRIVVLTTPQNAASYELLGSKCEVLFAPAKPMLILDAILALESKKLNKISWKAKVKSSVSIFAELKIPEFNLSKYTIPVVSFIYKNTALVLLAALFSVFVSYGIMIVFFMISSDWGAPLTLSKGHKLVVQAQRQMNDLTVKSNLVKQRLSKERRETLQARRVVGDAKVLAALVASTVDGEIGQRLVLQKDLQGHVKRLNTLRSEMKRALGASGAQRQLQRKFEKRLINRRTYDSSMLAILELRQRAGGVETEIAKQSREILKTKQSLLMLESLRKQIQEPNMVKIKAASAEFVPLANQIVAVKTTLINAQNELQSRSERLALLQKNSAILTTGIKEISLTPLARAIKAPVVVVFVPYVNAQNFKQDEPLYSCSLGIFWCKKVGYTGKAIPGEAVSVHPFFGKNIRGIFVEAILLNPEAAKKEVLHVGRPPLLF